MSLESIISRILLTIALGAFIGLGRDYNLSSDTADSDKTKNKNSQDKKSVEARQKFAFIKSAVPASGLGGLRTYILISLLGAVSGVAAANEMGYIALLFGGAIILFLIVSFVLNYFDKNTFGLTTEVSILLTFVLSFLMLASEIDVRLLSALFIVNAFVLSIKTETKALVSKFSRKEVVDTAKFALFSIVVWQFLPDVNYSLAQIPYVGEFFTSILGDDFTNAMNFFNPNRLWLIVVLISGMNFLGYFLIKVLGRNKGLNVVGLLGGFVSSTTVTQGFAAGTKLIKSEEATVPFVKAVLLANAVSFIRALTIIAVVNVAFIEHIWMPMAAFGLVFLIYFLHLTFSSKKKEGKIQAEILSTSKNKSLKRLGITFDSPFSFRPALLFGVIFVTVIIFTHTALYYFGNGGLIISSAVSAITGLDAIIINASSFAGSGEVAYSTAAFALTLAAGVNLLVKGIYAAMLGNRHYKIKVLRIFAIAIVAGLVAYYLSIAAF